jgi:hypothetical protein
MLAAFGWYTILVVCLNVVATGGGSNLFPLEDFPTFTQEDIEERIKGSKIVIVSEQAMLNTIYFIKACMLLMYTRLTMGLHQQRMVKAIAIYVACGWVGTEFAFFLACRPFNGYWAVPPPDPQCTTLRNFSIVQLCFNISSDLLMLAIMLPLLVQVNLPFRQKVALLAIFSLGSFVIVAAVLTKYFNLSDVYSTVYMLWYVREASTAVYVSNLPMIWPLLREWFPYLRKITPGHRSTSDNSKTGSGTTSSSMCGMRRQTTHGEKASLQMSTISKTSKSKVSHYNMGVETGIQRTDSAERINKPPFGGRGILAETTVNIDIDEGSSSIEDMDLEMQSQNNSHGRNRMHYGWDRSPSHTRTETNASAHEVIITGGKETEMTERRLESHERDVERESRREGEKTLNSHGKAEETGFVGQAV